MLENEGGACAPETPLVGRTLPRSQGGRRNVPTLPSPLAVVAVQLCVVDKLLAARLARSRREEDHRETIRACGQPMQKSTIGRAHADLHRNDSRLSETPELSIVACVPQALPRDDVIHAHTRRQDFAHNHHSHPLCDAPTPAVISLFLSTGRATLFPDRTYEWEQFFQLVGRTEWHLPRLA